MNRAYCPLCFSIDTLVTCSVPLSIVPVTCTWCPSWPLSVSGLSTFNTVLSFSDTITSLEPPSAHFLVQSALSMSLAPHFSLLTQPSTFVDLGAAKDTTELEVRNAAANNINAILFIMISSEDFDRQAVYKQLSSW